MQIDEVILHFLEGENEGVEIKLTPPRELFIGRSEESDIFLGEKKISRKHTMIKVDEDGIHVTDLDSTNGTFVNSKKITEAALRNGDKIKVGSSVIEVQIHKGAPSANASTAARPKEKSAPKIPPKKIPEKSKPKSKPVILEEDDEDLLSVSEKESDSAETMHANDLEELGVDDPPVLKPNPKKQQPVELEEDSDLVVEYQGGSQESRKASEHETSEKVQSVPSKEESAGDYDLNIEIEHDEPSSSRNLAQNESSYDKLPELQDQEEDIVEEEDDSKPVKNAKPLMGDLSAMGFSDLLQNLHQNKKTGVLKMSNNTSEGKVLISKGEILAATCDKSMGMKAMYRMLTWKSGDFEFQPVAVGSPELQTDQPRIEDSVETILMDGFRQYDELRKIQKVLPQMEEDLALEEHLDTPISKLHPKVLDVVQLIINHKKMKTILDLSHLSDLETSKIVFYLLKKKVIRIKK